MAEHKIAKDPVYGYSRLDPIPTEDQLEQFYQQEYYKKVRMKGATSVGKLANDGSNERQNELEWLQKTRYLDIADTLAKYLRPEQNRLLDVGCGTGEFLQFMQDRGWDSIGIEPAKDACKKAEQKGIRVYNLTIDKFLNTRLPEDRVFNALTLINILEHVANPEKLIYDCRKLIDSLGILCVRVPNDFNEFQLLANRSVNKKEWWIAAPEHINYFDFQSLEKLLQLSGFEVLAKTADFPMELFLLMGENYVDNPKLGKECHHKRIEFERNIPKELRRELYESLAQLGLGRECTVYARPKI